MKQRGIGLVEVMVVLAVAAALLVPLLTLSTRNAEDHQELLERTLAQGLCLDMMERFKRYKPSWALPGSPAQPPHKSAGPPLKEMFVPVEIVEGQSTLFDKVYLEQLAALGLSPKPKIEQIEDPARPGLFRLKISVSWKNTKGFVREVSFVRYGYAP